jgi:16S rRNA (guanine527-N7)-methyltransferase
MAIDKKIELSDSQIVSSLAYFSIHPTAEQISKIRDYITLLLKWNNLVSLTSITDPAEIVARHFGESMFAASLLPFQNGRLADVGSGAGFPGLALKILHKDLRVVLVESNKKKSAFLSEVVRSLALSDVEVLTTRFEEVRAEAGFVDFVTARALGGFPEILRWSKKALSPRGHLVLWVGGEDTPKISSTPGWTWQPAVRIPESQRRFILIGRPTPQPISRS